jgi:hypothetical protein
MAKDSKVVSIYPSDDEILEAHKGYKGKRELLVLSMDNEGQIMCSANTTDKAKIIFLIEVFKLHLIDGDFD